jgi:hypothetical protein
MQIIGKPFAEATVLRAGHAYETAMTWRDKRPAMSTALEHDHAEWNVPRPKDALFARRV